MRMTKSEFIKKVLNEQRERKKAEYKKYMYKEADYYVHKKLNNYSRM